MSPSSLRPCRLPFQSTRPGFSTAQKNLAKILTLIATIPPSPSPTDSVLGNSARPNANDVSPAPAPAPAPTPFEVSVNLDLRLGLSLEMSGGAEVFESTAEEEEEGIPTAHSGVINCVNQSLSYEASTVNKISKKALSAAESILEADTSSEGECSPEAAPIEHGTREISEITNGSCKPEDEINEGAEGGDGGYLDLLLEAARQVSGECGNDGEDESDEKASTGSGSRKRRRTTSSPEPLRSNPKKKRSPESAAAALNVCDEREPIVRSRRGRNQVLPLRYRDSILEPWRKLPTVSRR